MNDYTTRHNESTHLSNVSNDPISAKSSGDYSEKTYTSLTRSALTWCVKQSVCNPRYIFGIDAIDKFLTKRDIEATAEIDFKSAKKASHYQKGLMRHLAMHVNIQASESNDVVLPFTVRPLRINKTFFDTTNAELAKKFTDQFRKELRNALGIVEPEFYYIITGKGSKRHIHGCMRISEALYDDDQLTATKPVYDALKRSCGLTDENRELIARRDRRKAMYKFAISSPNMTGNSGKDRANPNRPYGHMAYIDSTARADYSQEKWAHYILSARNRSNKIYGTKKLAGEANELNDKFYSELKKLRSDNGWNNNRARFKEVIVAWSKVVADEISSTDKDYVGQETAELAGTPAEACEKDKVLEKKSSIVGNCGEASIAILKIGGSRKLKELIGQREECSEEGLAVEEEAYLEYRTNRPKLKKG